VAPLLFFVGVLFFSEYRAINVPDHACCFLAVMLFPFLIWLDVMNRTTATICLLFVLFAISMSYIQPSSMNHCHLTLWLLIITHLRDLCKRAHVDSDWVYVAVQRMVGV
jgi:hypothetical protein